MIERMKSIYVITSENGKDELIAKLKDLGILHLANRSAASSEATDKFAELSKAASELKEYSEKKPQRRPIFSNEEFEPYHQNVMATLQKKSEAVGIKNADLVDIDKIAKWGEFDPAELKELAENNIDLTIYLLGKKEYASLCEREDVEFIRLKSVDKMETVAVLGKPEQPIVGVEFFVPERGLAELNAEVAECDKTIAECDELLHGYSKHLNSYDDQLVKAQNVIEYSSATRTAEGEDGLTWISGYIPVSEADKFTAAAKENNWAWCMEDVIEDDGEVPTKVKYTKVTSLMKPVFNILGTVPGYNEYDISFFFLCFFALFVAMIIGDAAYGMIILIAAIAINIKTKKLSDAVLLLYVLSISTVIWGSVTGTWFAFKGAMDIPFLKALVIPQIANYPELFGVTTTEAQNNVMKFCFSIGLVHLDLACIMNIRTKLKGKDLSMIADLGWLMAISALYILVLYLVVGQTSNLKIVAGIVIAGFLLVVLFGGMSPDKTFAQGLKAGLADAFTTFLDTISAFGNVMSYIRLFAVGMASLAIAQSFNDMAAGFGGPLVILAALIMIIGHVLNIVMAVLSVAVHGIRLNLLEFSGQLGMEWSGKEYDPFRELDKVRK